MVMHTKAILQGDTLILVWTCFAIVTSYIGCELGHMTISRDNLAKKLTLYPLAKSTLDLLGHVFVFHLLILLFMF